MHWAAMQQPIAIKPVVPVASPGSFSPTDLYSISTPESLGTQAHSISHTRQPSVTSRGFNPRSCNTCRRRKVKCDKVEGSCGNCTKNRIECVYPGPGRAPRKPKSKSASERETELLKRLRRLEGVVGELSGQVENEVTRTTSAPTQIKGGGLEGNHSDKSNGTPVRVVGMDEGSAAAKEEWTTRMLNFGGGPPRTDMIENEFGKLVIDEGKSRYISNSFWARFNNEIGDIREMFEEDEERSDEDEDGSSPGDSAPGSAAVDSSDHHSFVLGYSSAKLDLRHLHPLPSQIPFYWETFKENVDPLVKLLHIPTMTKTMKEVKDNLGSLSRSTEALCFAIYFATIASMNEEEVKSNFAVEKSFLINQYRFATEQALARAGFLQTCEIVTVQAFVLFLIVVRRFDESKFVWTLVGLVIRIAQSLGLHRDGTNFNISPFNTEMRRRCWWQICTLDVRAAEDYGSDPTIMEYSFDTQLPLNINDEDIDPQSTELPAPRIGRSEITFCLIRFEICNTNRQLSYVPPKDGPCKRAAQGRTLAEKEELVRELHERLEAKYLTHCYNAGPLYWVAATVARLIIAKMELVIYSPYLSEGLPQTVKDRLFVASIQIMEYSQLLEREISTRKWGWLFHTYVQWYAIAFILGEICARPYSDILERGWRAVDAAFEDWDDAVKRGKNGMLWTPMRKLMAKARKKREADIQALRASTASSHPIDTPPPPPPRDLVSVPTPTEPSITSPEFLPADLDLIRPLQPSLSLGGQWTELSRLNSNSMDNPTSALMPALSQQQHMQSQLQEQSQQDGHMPSRPWILDDSALIDLDMNDIDGDAGLDGWNDIANYFQMEPDPSLAPDGRGQMFGGGLGSWL